MRSYFHCSTARYSRRAAVVAVLVGSACAETAVIAFVVMFFGIFGTLGGGASPETSGAMLAVAGIVISAGLAVCYLSAFAARRKIAMNSRYTFLDIQQKFFVISLYDKEFGDPGEKEIYRMLYLVPFSGFDSAEPSRGGKKLVIKGKIKLYGLPSDSLGYHIRGGDIEFDRWWLNSGGYEEHDAVELPALFGDPAKICRALAEAKKAFDEIPRPVRREFREADHIRLRPKPRVMPESLDFSRRWK